MIQISDSGYAAGTVIVAAAIQPRYYEFQLSLDVVGVPVGTKLLIERSCDITQNFNNGVKKAIGNWVWFLGDDHAFSPDLLLKLLRYNVDVVVPITPCKVPPWAPCVLHGPYHEKMPLYYWDELSGPGLFPLPQNDFIGQAGMLVKKAVLDKIGYPWFKCGQIDKGRLQEDLFFCRDLQHHGYTVNIDQESIFDHYGPVCITARKHEGKWIPALKMGTGPVVVMPYCATRTPEIQDSNSESDRRGIK